MVGPSHSPRRRYDPRGWGGLRRSARSESLGTQPRRRVVRRSRRHDGAPLHRDWWLYSRPGGHRHACRNGLHVERSAHGRELADLRLVDSPRPVLVLPEAVCRHTNHRVGHGHVPVHVDVRHVDGGRPGHDDVVDDARPTPAVPRGDADEPAAPPPGNDRFAPAERRPAERPNTDAHSHATAEEDDESRRVHRPDDEGTGGPRPIATNEDPATVMIRCPPPGRVVEPRPAEAWIPDPPAGAVRHPARGHARGHPHGAVRLDSPPAPVLLERFGPVDGGRHVARARRLKQIVRALVVPAVPCGELRRSGHLYARRLGACDHHLLVGGDLCRSATGSRHRGHAAAVRREGGGIRPHAYAVESGTLDGEDRVRSIELDGVARGKLAHVQGSVSARHTELEEIGLLVVEANLGFLGGAYERTWANLDLHVPARTRIEDVARRQGRVDPRWGPVLGARPPEGHFAVNVADAGRCDFRRLP